MTAIAVIFYAMAYMRSGHPPASGYVFLIVMFITSPLAIISVLFGFFINKATTTLNPKLVFSMLGVNIVFVFIVLCIVIFKVILGKPI
ncbi:hypothetical protein BTA51_20565 [Hahella sp. CCB-MM4]|nr:hypothetical protein BTA51_20565 [Hahella sp. CCB-MM4]